MRAVYVTSPNSSVSYIMHGRPHCYVPVETWERHLLALLRVVLWVYNASVGEIFKQSFYFRSHSEHNEYGFE